MRTVLVYFRKDLRIHDNPTLTAALQLNPSIVIPIYILDASCAIDARCGANRWIFLLESLKDLDNVLRVHGSRLLVLRGDPLQVLPQIYKAWKITDVYHEIDTEHFWQKRDALIASLSKTYNVNVLGIHGRTLYNPIDVIKANKNKAPLTIVSFQNVIAKLPKPASPLPTIIDYKFPANFDSYILSVDDFKDRSTDESTGATSETLSKEKRVHIWSLIPGPNKNFDVPTIEELGFPAPSKSSPYKGGETAALKKLDEYCSDKMRVAKFEKPNTNPAAFNPAETTVLSPHLKFGTLSCRLFYKRILDIYTEIKAHSQPPVSLLSQLYWRDFYYTVNAVTPNYHIMEGNPVSLQVDWWCKESVEDPVNQSATEHLRAWTMGETGFPWIDAIMIQLRKEGWIHHLARHSVACFLTRGDLFVSWERGAEVFEELLIDHDEPLNIGNWLWLSSSAFYTTYFRVYSPIAFAKKHDPEGKFIKHYLPVLKNFPKKYIFEPWKASIADQKKWGCIVGKDYPKPIVEHDIVVKENMARMKAAYAQGKRGEVKEGAYFGPLAAPFVSIKTSDNSTSNKKIKTK